MVNRFYFKKLFIQTFDPKVDSSYLFVCLFYLINSICLTNGSFPFESFRIQAFETVGGPLLNLNGFQMFPFKLFLVSAMLSQHSEGLEIQCRFKWKIKLCQWSFIICCSIALWSQLRPAKRVREMASRWQSNLFIKSKSEIGKLGCTHLDRVLLKHLG